MEVFYWADRKKEASPAVPIPVYYSDKWDEVPFCSLHWQKPRLEQLFEIRLLARIMLIYSNHLWYSKWIYFEAAATLIQRIFHFSLKGSTQ